MSDEIERLRAVLEAMAPYRVDATALGAYFRKEICVPLAALAKLSPALLAVADAVDPIDDRPRDRSPKCGTSTDYRALFAALDELRAAIREHLGEP